MDTLQPPTQMSDEARLLVVDDESDIRDMLTDILKFEGYEVRTAEDGEVALQLAAENHFDLILTDLHMPNMGGLELIQRIRRKNPDIPFIVITGFPSLTKAVEVMKCGAVDFLPKPFEIETVLHVVRRTLKEHDLTLENRRLLAEVNQKAVIEKLNRELHSRISELTKLNMISEQLSRVIETSTLFDEVVRLAAQVTESQRVSLMLFDRHKQILRIRAAIGLSARVLQETEIPLGQGVAGRVAFDKRPLRVTRTMPHPSGESPSPGLYSRGSWLSVPLVIGDILFGVLNATERRDRADFGPDDERLLVSLADKAAAKIENNALYESLYDNLLDTLHSLVTTIEAKDPYTHRHSQRVTDLAVSIGESLKLERNDVEALRFATVLHDIGKIAIRDNVLMKPGRLNDEEYSTIKLHPKVGDHIVEPLGLTMAERDIIRHHHERPDGKGYPDGLAGDDISILARIVTIADCFDAMTSTRPYRTALSTQEAFGELERWGGQQFDGEIVALFRSGVEASEISIRPQEERETAPAAEASG